MIGAILFLVVLAIGVEVVCYLNSRPSKPNPDIKGLSMVHWEGPDR